MTDERLQELRERATRLSLVSNRDLLEALDAIEVLHETLRDATEGAQRAWVEVVSMQEFVKKNL